VQEAAACRARGRRAQVGLCTSRCQRPTCSSYESLRWGKGGWEGLGGGVQGC
jgi:hypothetical protein